jgi:hypothetical protein
MIRERTIPKKLMGLLITHNPKTDPFSPTVHQNDQS